MEKQVLKLLEKAKQDQEKKEKEEKPGLKIGGTILKA